MISPKLGHGKKLVGVSSISPKGVSILGFLFVFLSISYVFWTPDSTKNFKYIYTLLS